MRISQRETSELIDRLDKEVDEFGDEWYHFIKMQQSRRSSHAAATVWDIAMTALDARQVGNLDAVRAVTLQGRPAAAKALLRSMYDTMTSVLLLGFGDGITTNPGGRVWTLDELADRFRAYGLHARLQHIEYLRQHPEGADLLPEYGSEDRLLEIESAFQQERARYSFGNGTATWHPFGGMHKVKDLLWPPDSSPVYPPEITPVPRSIWVDLYFLCWKLPSHDVHGGYVSLSHAFVQDGGGLIDAGRTWDPHPLRFALLISRITTAAYATAIDCQDLWVEALNGRPGWIERWARGAD